MRPLKIPIRSDRKAVKAFLDELRELLSSKDFNVEEDLLIIKSNKSEVQYSTAYLMTEFEYDAEDIARQIAELTIHEYSQTLIDEDDDKPPLLYVFGKMLNGKLVYIKLKIKGDSHRKVLCLSFHFAKYDMDFPYK